MIAATTFWLAFADIALVFVGVIFVGLLLALVFVMVFVMVHEKLTDDEWGGMIVLLVVCAAIASLAFAGVACIHGVPVAYNHGTYSDKTARPDYVGPEWNCNEDAGIPCNQP